MKAAASLTLQHLVADRLLRRTQGMSAASVAAYLAGWSSALQLVRRVHVWAPWTSAEQRQLAEDLVAAIESASKIALAETDP